MTEPQKIDKKTRKRAMNLIKRKIKSYNLESYQYGSEITAINPPDEIEQTTLDRLVELGKLKKVAKNLYALGGND